MNDTYFVTHHRGVAVMHEEIGRMYAEEGRHNEAGHRYQWAADSYRQAGMPTEAGDMDFLACYELAQVRPSAPVNISALVE